MRALVEAAMRGVKVLLITPLARNRELGILLTEGEIQELLHRTFEADWRSSEGGGPIPLYVWPL